MALSGVQLVWATALIVTLTMLPVGVIRMVAYRSGQIDHTPTLRFVAWVALVIGGLALAVFLGMTAWFLVNGGRPA